MKWGWNFPKAQPLAGRLGLYKSKDLTCVKKLREVESLAVLIHLVYSIDISSFRHEISSQLMQQIQPIAFIHEELLFMNSMNSFQLTFLSGYCLRRVDCPGAEDNSI